MKDRLLGMSLSYHRMGDSISDPLVREELFFQGDSSMEGYADDESMPFQIVSLSGMEPQRSITENAPPARVQNRELTVYLRVRDRDMDVHTILGKYLDAVDTSAYSLHAPDGPFYVPTASGGAGIITLTLLMGDGTPYAVKRYECKVSIKSITGDMFAPSNSLYVLVMTMHDEAFIRYNEPYQVIWELPYEGAFVNPDGNNIPRGIPEVTRLPDGVTRNRLTRPRITIEATAVEAVSRKRQNVSLYGYYNNPVDTNTLSDKWLNLLDVEMDINQVINPEDQLINVGETVALTINDPFTPGDSYKAPRSPDGTSAAYYFDNGRYIIRHQSRGFEYMNFPIADGATVQIMTGTSDTPGGTGKSAADVKITMDFFDTLTGVVL